jgi:hypothetical protein
MKRYDGVGKCAANHELFGTIGAYEAPVYAA